jgi:hypothetical protein
MFVIGPKATFTPFPRCSWPIAFPLALRQSRVRTAICLRRINILDQIDVPSGSGIDTRGESRHKVGESHPERGIFKAQAVPPDSRDGLNHGMSVSDPSGFAAP